MSSLFIYGNSGVGSELLYMIEKNKINRWEEICFLNDFDNNKLCMGKRVLSLDECMNSNAENKEFIVAVGEPEKRKFLYNKIKKSGGKIVSVFFDSDISSGTKIGDGTITQINSVIAPNVSIGDDCLLNQSVIIGHDCKIGNHCVLSQGVCVGGFTEIGNNVYIGSRAVIRDRVKIGNNCIIGMGAVVIKDVADGDVVVGTPAIKIRKNEDGVIFK